MCSDDLIEKEYGSEIALAVDEKLIKAKDEIAKEISAVFEELRIKCKTAITLEEQVNAYMEYQGMILYFHETIKMPLPKSWIKISPDYVVGPATYMDKNDYVQ